MINMRTGTILIIFFLAISISGVLLPLAQAQSFILTPTAKDPDFHDAAGPAEPVLQKSNEVFTSLDLDRKGAVDWMAALNSGIIAPRAGVKEMTIEKMDVLDLDVTMKNTKEMPYVKFPHNSHTKWLACVNCHDEIFIKKAGSSEINMNKIFMGEYCGICHGKVAFTPTNTCERCHSVPHGDTKAWW